MRLTVCLVTRDAERNIERALRSVTPLGAEVVVADTGSRDGTVAIARSFGATIHAVSWRDDFAEAQNLALEQARGDWILWLNPDEELLAPNRELLATLLARADALAYAVRVQELARADQMDGRMEIWMPRLFRRRPDLRYVGRIHPQFTPTLEEVARRHGMNLYRTDVVIRHHAYTSVLSEDKLRWATRLLELELQDRPAQLHSLIEYGRNLLRLNEPRGHSVLAGAADLVAGATDSPIAPSPSVSSLLEYLLTVSSQQSRSSISSEQAIELVKRWFPNSPPLVWLLAERAFKAGAFQEAARMLERLVELGRTGNYDHSAAFNPALMRELALLNLGSCYLRLGDPRKAEVCFAQLLTDPVHGEQARRGHAQSQAMQARR